jgi:aromatic-L-amino-acid decarboxylase
MRADEEAIDQLNRAILTDIQLSGEAFLSSTVIHDRFWLRACIVNPLARSEDIDFLVGLVKERGRQLAHPA